MSPIQRPMRNGNRSRSNSTNSTNTDTTARCANTTPVIIGDNTPRDHEEESSMAMGATTSTRTSTAAAASVVVNAPIGCTNIAEPCSAKENEDEDANLMDHRMALDLSTRRKTHTSKMVQTLKREKGSRKKSVTWTNEEIFYVRQLVEKYGTSPKILQQMVDGKYKHIFKVNGRSGKDIADKFRRDNNNPNGGYLAEAAMLSRACARKRKRIDEANKNHIDGGSS